MKQAASVRHFWGGKAGKLNRSRGGDILMLLILLGFAAFSALPILLVLLQSVKPLNELFIYCLLYTSRCV